MTHLLEQVTRVKMARQLATDISKISNCHGQWTMHVLYCRHTPWQNKRAWYRITNVSELSFFKVHTRVDSVATTAISKVQDC